MIKDGMIEAVKVGRTWVITISSLEECRIGRESRGIYGRVDDAVEEKRGGACESCSPGEALQAPLSGEGGCSAQEVSG
jgi:hypothetical protein